MRFRVVSGSGRAIAFHHQRPCSPRRRPLASKAASADRSSAAEETRRQRRSPCSKIAGDQRAPALPASSRPMIRRFISTCRAGRTAGNGFDDRQGDDIEDRRAPIDEQDDRRCDCLVGQGLSQQPKWITAEGEREQAAGRNASINPAASRRPRIGARATDVRASRPRPCIARALPEGSCHDRQHQSAGRERARPDTAATEPQRIEGQGSSTGEAAAVRVKIAGAHNPARPRPLRYDPEQTQLARGDRG